jgi:hypothetical protein
MPIYLKDLLDNRNLLKDLRNNQQKCCRCGVVLQETVTGKRKVPEGHACSDCYYGDFDEELDRHPIGSAGIRRG